MPNETDQPEWLCRARNLWTQNGTPSGLDAKWSAIWIKKFLKHLEGINGGALPREIPNYSAASAFRRTLSEKWGLEDWKVEQAGMAIDWLLDAAGSHGVDDGPAEFPVRVEVELKGANLVAISEVERHFVEDGGLEHLTRLVARRKGRALTTEKGYLTWLGQFRRWWGKQSISRVELLSKEQASEELERAISSFLDHLAVVEDVAVATQRQALNALVFAFRACLGWIRACYQTSRERSAGGCYPLCYRGTRSLGSWHASSPRLNFW